MQKKDGCLQSGFSLIELLVVLAIIGIISALLLSAVQSAREAARRVTCSNRLHQISLATLNFESSEQRLPSGIIAEPSSSYVGRTWLQELLPFIEENAKFERSNQEFLSGLPATSHVGLQTVVASYACPSYVGSDEPHFTLRGYFIAPTSYVGNSGTNHLSKDGVLFDGSVIRMSDIKDGTSNTILAGERPPSFDWWLGWWYFGSGIDGDGSAETFLGARELTTDDWYVADCEEESNHFSFPAVFDNPCNALRYWSAHPGGGYFTMCDGSVRFVSYSEDSILPILATVRGGEPTPQSN